MNFTNFIPSDIYLLWDSIIYPEYFYLNEIYYDLIGDLMPGRKADWYIKMTKEEQKKYCIEKFGKRPEDDDNIVWDSKWIEIDGEKAGWICWETYKDYHKRGKVHLKYIVLKSEYQGKGYGKQVMFWFINMCYELGKRKITLIYESNKRGLTKFYEMFGFRCRGGWGINFRTLTRDVKRPMKRMPKSKKE